MKLDANDVAVAQGPAGMAATLDDLTAKAPDATPAALDWPEPTPLDTVGPLPPFPVDALPGWLRDMVSAVATSTQTPADLAGTLGLGILALCGAGKFRVQVKQDWTEPLNLYTVCSLLPGCRKSAVFSILTEPLLSWERAEAERLGPEIAKARADYEIRKQHLEELKGRAAKAKDPTERAKLTAEAQDEAAALASAELPTLPQLWTDDATPEKLPGLLSAQGGRIGILSAEGHAFEMAAGLYSDGNGNLNVYLKGHAGDALRVDRIGRPPDYVERPALTVALCVQPDVIESLSRSPGFRGRGLLGRFLYSLPVSPLGSRDVDPPAIPPEILAAYHQNVNALLSLPWTQGASGQRCACPLNLSLEARALLLDFLKELEPKLAAGGELGSMTDWAGKLAGAVARMAAGFHIAENRVDPRQIPISAEAVAAGIELARYFTAHAKAAFSLMGADPAVELAKRVLAWIARKGCRDFARRDVIRILGNAPEVDAALALLVESDFLRQILPPPQTARLAGRKPGPKYQTNPRILEQTK